MFEHLFGSGGGGGQDRTLLAYTTIGAIAAIRPNRTWCVYLVNGHIGHEIVSKLVSDISDIGVVSGSGLGKDGPVIATAPRV